MKDGYEIVRGAADPAWVRWCRERVERWFCELDGRVADGERSPALDVLVRQSGASLGASRVAELRTPPGVLSGLLDHLSAAGLLTKTLVPTTEACSVRRQPPEAHDKALGWHTDAAVINRADGLVFWTPLDDLDRYTPSLVIIPNHAAPLAHHVNEASRYLEVDESPVGDRVEIFGMQQGDVLVMPLGTPHRTLLTRSMTRTRFSIDLRAVGATP